MTFEEFAEARLQALLRYATVLTAELAGRRVVDIRAQRGHLSRPQLTAAAAAVQLTPEPSFAWLTGRP